MPGDAQATNSLSKIVHTRYELVLVFGAGGFTTVKECVLPVVIGTERFECDVPVDFEDLGISERPPSYDEALSRDG